MGQNTEIRSKMDLMYNKSNGLLWWEKKDYIINFVNPI